MGVISNPQMAVSSIPSNGIFTHSTHLHSSNLSPSSWFGINFTPIKHNHRQQKQMQILNIRASLGGGGGGGGDSVIEKELEFKPSFDHYLKALESVKSGRQSTSSSSSSSVNKNQPFPDSRNSQLVKVDSRTTQVVKVKGGEKHKSRINQPTHDSRKTRLVKEDSRTTQFVKVKESENGKLRISEDGILETGSESSHYRNKNTAESSIRSTGKTPYLKIQEEKGQLKVSVEPSSRGKSTSRKFVKLNDEGSKVVARGAGVAAGKERNDISRGDSEYRKFKVAREVGFVERKNSGDELDSIVRLKRDLAVDMNRVQGKVEGRNAERVGPRGETNGWPVVRSGTSGSYVNRVEKKSIADLRRVTEDMKPRRSKLIVQYGSDDDLTEDRAAFKPLEEGNDAYDKPRISRVDMDERIQRLAKCLNGADIDMPEWIFSKMMRSAKLRFSDHSVMRLIQILGKYGNWQRVLQVVEWFQLRERFKSHKIRYVYTAALDALGKARRPVEALNVFNSMQQQFDSYPDLVAYRCIAVTLGQAGHMKELFDVIDVMRSPPKKKFTTGVLQKWDPRLEPDLVIYNAVLNACVHRKNWEGAFWVLQQLKQQGQHPSSTTYGLVMEVMLACGKYGLVHEFFRKVQKSHIPNALTYKVLVNTLWKQGNVDDAVFAVEDMERRGIVGSAGLYYDLARCLCSAGRCQDAIMQIDKICKVANKPLVVTYTGLIQACLDSGNIQSGIYIFNHMLKFCSPNLITCNIMLKGYLDCEMFEEARELFQKLLENGIGRNKHDNRDSVRPDIYTFNLMLDACAGKHLWDDLEYFYGKMLQHGYHFNAKRHLRMIMDACRNGKVELLDITWKHLVQKNQNPPPALIKEMFRLKLQQDDFAAAFSCIESLPSSESDRFSAKSWLKFFRENDNSLWKDTLVRLAREVSVLISRSGSPNPVFQNLLICCKEILRTQMTVAEVDQTEAAGIVKC